MSESSNIEKQVYEPKDIQKILGMSRSKTYNFLELVHKNRHPFIVMKIDRLYKIPKDSFDKWLSGLE